MLKGAMCNNCTYKNEYCSQNTELEPYVEILFNIQSVVEVSLFPPAQTRGSSGRLQEQCRSARRVQQATPNPKKQKQKNPLVRNYTVGFHCQTPLTNCSI